MSKKSPGVTVVCALKEELAAVRAGLGKDGLNGFELIQAGIGPRRAEAVAKELAGRAHPPRVVISTGFCGGLSDELKLGDVLVGTDIAHQSSSAKAKVATNALAQKIYLAISGAGVHAHLGRMFCSDTAVSTAERKRALGKEFSALAVDMESHALAVNCPRETCLIFVRAVSDTVDDELPAEVVEFLDENGRPRLGKVAKFALSRPGNVKKLMGLGRRANAAAKALTAAWRVLREVELE